MDNFGIPLLIFINLVILVVDYLSFSYLKTALLGMQMQKKGFFLSSAAICLFSVIFSLTLSSTVLQNLTTARAEDAAEIIDTVEVVEVPNAGETEAVAEMDPAAETTPEPEPETDLSTEVEVTPESEPEQETTAVRVEEVKTPSFSVWRGFLKGFSYNFIEVENGIPYVYMPSIRGDFQSDINNIAANKEGGNILVMANAGIFSDDTEPLGAVIQNGELVSSNEGEGGWCWTLVVDEDGNVGYVDKAVRETTMDYIDARTGKAVIGKKIVSAVYAFVPFIINNKVIEDFRGNYDNIYRARQIFCVKQNSYAIITNMGEGEDGGGWDFDDMVQVAKYRGCVSAFNLDGGGSTATAYRLSLNNDFSILATTKRRDPTFIVFTADNLAPRGK